MVAVMAVVVTVVAVVVMAIVGMTIAMGMATAMGAVMAVVAAGIVAAMMVAGPGVSASGAINGTYLTVMDLAPTFLDIAGARYPDDGSVRPMLGESATRFLAGKTDVVHDENYVTAQFSGGRAYLRKGHWKISTLDPPFSEEMFELYDLATDPAETTNLADDEPEKLTELVALWRVQRKALGILLPEDL